MEASKENTPQADPLLRIFYDGGCRVCAWEIKKYLKYDSESRLGTIDINQSDFQAEKYGLDRESVQKYFHVLTADGRVIGGVDAFIEIWKTLGTPLSLRAARVARTAPIHRLLEWGYRGFVEIRPYLPRNENLRCDDGSCLIAGKKH